jgi:hypothetical protein
MVIVGPTFAQGRNAQAVAFTAADVDAFQRGFKEELPYLHKPPKTASNRFGDVTEEAQQAAMGVGAKAAGLDLNRYRQLHDVILNVLRTLDIQGKIPGPVQVDMSRVSPEQRKQLERDPFVDLPGPSATALREKVGQLAPMWVEYINMTAVAG